MSKDKSSSRNGVRTQLRTQVRVARTRVSDAQVSAIDTVERNPVAAVAVAAATGAILASAIPTSRREEELLRPVASKARSAANKAIETAKTSGVQHLTASGLTATAVSSGLAGLLSAVLKANAVPASQQQAEPAPATTPEPEPWPKDGDTNPTKTNQAGESDDTSRQLAALDN